MREALARWWAPVLARLPDPRGVPLRKQVTTAVVVSALLHILLFFIAALFLALSPQRIDFARTQPKLKPLEIQLLPPPPEEAPQLFTLSALEQPEFLDSTGLAKADDAPENPIFESDENMRAASELPATGEKPLPSLDGRTDRMFDNFKTQQALLGPKPEPLAADITLAAIPTPTPPPPPEPPVPNEPLFKPQPVPAEKPEPTPPLKKVVEPQPDEIALASNKATSAPTDNLTRPKPVLPDVPKPQPEKSATPPPIMPPTKPQPSPELAKLITPAPKPVRMKNSGYQPQLEKTKIEGSISNRGKAGVDAVRTPLGVYKKQISEAIGSRWLYYVKQRMDIVTIGVASVSFFVTKEGRVQDIRILTNTSNESFAQLCEQSVREAEFAPAPPETFDAMKDGRLEITFTFNLYPN